MIARSLEFLESEVYSDFFIFHTSQSQSNLIFDKKITAPTFQPMTIDHCAKSHHNCFIFRCTMRHYSN